MGVSETTLKMSEELCQPTKIAKAIVELPVAASPQPSALAVSPVIALAEPQGQFVVYSKIFTRFECS